MSKNPILLKYGILRTVYFLCLL